MNQFHMVNKKFDKFDQLDPSFPTSEKLINTMYKMEDNKGFKENESDTIVTVSELIDSAFGDPDVNVVHHKKLQTVLYLLARQLRLLERRVTVKVRPKHMLMKPSHSSISVTEIKLKASNQALVETSAALGSKKDHKSIKNKKSLPSEEPIVRSTKFALIDDELSRASYEYSAAGGKTTDHKSLSDETEHKSSAVKKSTEKGAIIPSTRLPAESKQQRDKSKYVSKIRHTNDSKIDPQAYQQILDRVEELRERELRVIRQRADSHEESGKTPTPIASLDSVEATFEKLLVVEHVPAKEAAARAARIKSGTDGSAPRVSVVTLEQFEALASEVHQLQQQLQPVGSFDFPENIELMQELRKGASLTDAMAALQLSARLEATEKTLNKLLSLVTDMAAQLPGYKLSGDDRDNVEVIFGNNHALEIDDKNKRNYVSIEEKETLAESATTDWPQSGVITDNNSLFTTKIDGITFSEVQQKLEGIEEEIMKRLSTIIEKSTTSANSSKRLILKLEQKVNEALNLGTRMDDLETKISSYVEQINRLDTGLSSQLTNYQEELTRMQHDLESGLENMNEVLANTGGDATAVAELNTHFNNLQLDIDNAVLKQFELREIQNKLSLDLDGLRAQIELLRDVKSDREEVTDALRDKAGLSDLNGLISIQQFNAVMGDMEKRLVAAYDTFNNQELVWQKAIDDLLKDLNEKADIMLVDNLREQINHHLEMLRKRIQFIMDIVGEPVAAALARKICRDSACLSCSAPAHMDVEESTVPVLPAMKAKTMAADKPKDDGDHGLRCAKSNKVPNDPRAHVCRRWCGGSHTKIALKMVRMPHGFATTQLNRNVNMEQGTDGKVTVGAFKMYVVDKEEESYFCTECNAPLHTVTPAPSGKQLEETKKSATPDSLSMNMFPQVSAGSVDGTATPPMIESSMLLYK